MAKVCANGIDIEYEVLGDESSPPLLLIMGLGAQLVGWDDEFCEALVGRGFRVIRYDNRDVGLSTKMEHLGLPNMLEVAAQIGRGETITPPYTLSEMADDAAGLLDCLGIEQAHVVGASMGGMIAQALAIRHTARVLSLTSIMSSTGHPGLAQPKPEAVGLLLLPSPRDREQNIERAVAASSILSGGGYELDVERIRAGAACAYDRCDYPDGSARQLLAILGSGSRRDDLAKLDLPALVIHGGNDPLIPLDGGIDTHRALAGSELMVIEGMGHELPVQVWPQILDGIDRVAGRATDLRAEAAAGS